MGEVPNGLAAQRGELLEVPRAEAAQPLEVRPDERDEAPEQRPADEGEQRVPDRPPPVGPEGNLGWLDDRDHRRVAHLLDLRLLERLRERRVRLLPQREVALEAAELDRQAGRGAEGAVADEEVGQPVLGRAELGPCLLQPGARERALLGRLRLPVAQVVVADERDEAGRELMRQHRVRRRDRHGDDARLRRRRGLHVAGEPLDRLLAPQARRVARRAVDLRERRPHRSGVGGVGVGGVDRAAEDRARLQQVEVELRPLRVAAGHREAELRGEAAEVRLAAALLRDEAHVRRVGALAEQGHRRHHGEGDQRRPDHPPPPPQHVAEQREDRHAARGEGRILGPGVRGVAHRVRDYRSFHARISLLTPVGPPAGRPRRPRRRPEQARNIVIGRCGARGPPARTRRASRARCDPT
jgi:hypothetical protein